MGRHGADYGLCISQKEKEKKTANEEVYDFLVDPKDVRALHGQI